MYKLFFKRVLDLILSFIAILVLSPVMIIISILILIKLGNPIIYAIERPGKNEMIFIMYKFRTMNIDRDEFGELLADNIRLTRFGRLLRSTSLDELPELYNILIGDMSIVGPRPLAMQYLSFYTEMEQRRHSVRPGLTGLAQINGRNDLNWESKFAYDIEYVDKITFLSDIKIICKTISKVIKRDSIGVRGIDAHEDFDKYRTRQFEQRKEGTKL